MSNPRTWPNHPVRNLLQQQWREQAACSGKFHLDWMPERYWDAVPALTICLRCPVRMQCYREAVNHHETGVWGGRIFAHGTPQPYRFCRQCKNFHGQQSCPVDEYT